MAGGEPNWLPVRFKELRDGKQRAGTGQSEVVRCYEMSAWLLTTSCLLYAESSSEMASYEMRGYSCTQKAAQLQLATS